MQKTKSVAPTKLEGVQDDKPETRVMAVDEYYPDGHVAKTLADCHISRRNARFYGVMGF